MGTKIGALLRSGMQMGAKARGPELSRPAGKERTSVSHSNPMGGPRCD